DRTGTRVLLHFRLRRRLDAPLRHGRGEDRPVGSAGDPPQDSAALLGLGRDTGPVRGQVPCSGVAVGSFVEGSQALSSKAISGSVLTPPPGFSTGVSRQRARTSSPR